MEHAAGSWPRINAGPVFRARLEDDLASDYVGTPFGTNSFRDAAVAVKGLPIFSPVLPCGPNQKNSALEPRAENIHVLMCSVLRELVYILP